MTTTRRPDKQPLVSNEEFALLVDALEDYAIFLMSPAGEIRSWNRGAARIMGYDEAEVIGRKFSIFYTPDDLASGKPRRELEDAIRDSRVEDEGWRVRKDGTRFWANTVITVLRDENGGVRCFAKVTRDLSARREAEEQLRESTENFQLLVSCVRDYAIFMLDPNGNVATWNEGAQRIKGYAPEEIIGRHFSAFYGEEDLRDGKPERELRIARAEGSIEDEGWRVRKDGSRFWANVVITAVHDGSGKLRGFAKITRDVTERKRAEQTQRALLEQREARLQAEEQRRQAEASYSAAQDANRAKDEFLMTLSHELRTPMTAIIGWTRMLPSIAPEDPLFQEAVASIASSARMQAHLIDDILDVSRIVSGKLRLAPETIDVALAVMNAVDAISPTAGAKQIKLTTSFAPGLGFLVADATRIQQVIWNLLSNSVKFTPRGGAVQVSARRTASQVQIAVSDNGDGIDPAFLPHIFEPFRQAEMPQTRAHGGLGLGLSIVRYIAEAHCGTVTAESEGRGKGATFTVTLPVRATAPQAAIHPSMTPLGSRLKGLQVVLVEDDAESRKMVTAVLRAAGAKVVPVDSARAAIDAVRHSPPDLVITDIALPGVDGYTLTQTLRELESSKRFRIVALSAFPARNEEPHGFDLWLSKPIDPFYLVDEIVRIAEQTPV
jgi:PAS domain S-box-containing protein